MNTESSGHGCVPGFLEGSAVTAEVIAFYRMVSFNEEKRESHRSIWDVEAFARNLNLKITEVYVFCQVVNFDRIDS